MRHSQDPICGINRTVPGCCEKSSASGWVTRAAGGGGKSYTSMIRIPKNVFSLPCFSQKWRFMMGIMGEIYHHPTTYHPFSCEAYKVEGVSCFNNSSFRIHCQALVFQKDLQGTFGSISFIVASTMRRPTGYGVACACELGSLVPTDHFGSQKHVHFAAQNRCSSLPAGKSQMTTAWFAHKCMWQKLFKLTSMVFHGLHINLYV